MNCNVENGRQEAAEIKKTEKPKPAKPMPKATARVRPQDGIAKSASKKATSNVSCNVIKLNRIIIELITLSVYHCYSRL